MLEVFTFELLDFRYLRNNEGLNVIFPSGLSIETYKLEELSVMLAENKFSVEVMGRILTVMGRLSYADGACFERRNGLNFIRKNLDDVTYY
jgi:hypothetical protein